MKHPFIHKFETKTNKYIYDVNTNQILRVDDIIFKIIDFYGHYKEDEIINKFKDKFDIDKIRNSLYLIKKYSNEKGLFSSFRPSKMEYGKRGNLKKLYQYNLSQLTLNITENCNMRCKYCSYSGTYIYERKHSSKFMNFQIAKRGIDFLLNNSKNKDRIHFSFYGGEPLLNFEVIKKCVEYINICNIRKNHSFGITTNGTLLKNDIIKFFIDNDFMLLISLDGPIQRHDRYRIFKNGKGSFNVVINKLKEIREMDIDYFNQKVGFSTIIAPPYNDFENIFSFFKNNFSNSHRVHKIGFVNKNDTTFFDKFDKNDLDAKKFLNFIYNQYVNNVIKGDLDTIKLHQNLIDKNLLLIHRRSMSNLGEKVGLNGCCLPGLRKIFVSPKGNFYICEKIGYSYLIGNIYEGFNFDKIFDLMDEYCKISIEHCTKCWAIRLCPACFVNAIKNQKLDIQRKREYCDSNKSYINKLLEIYCTALERNPQAFNFMEDYIYG